MQRISLRDASLHHNNKKTMEGVARAAQSKWLQKRINGTPQAPQDDHAKTKASEARFLLDHPPDGVDLGILDPSKGTLSPEECQKAYERAFEQAGGEAAMQNCKELLEKLQAEMSGEIEDYCKWGRSWEPHQMRVWQSYNLEFMMNRLGDGSAVRLQGKQRLQDLERQIQRDIHPEVELKTASMKQWGRAFVKVLIKYASDCSQLCDLNRATLVCPDIHVMYNVAQRIFAEFGPQVCRQDARLVEWEDHYENAMPGGYRHLQAVISIGGSLWELQLNTKDLIEAKGRAGHKLYKTTRFVQEMLLFASIEGDFDVLQDLLSHPGVREMSNPNLVKDRNGLYALHHAAFRGDLKIVEVLLDRSRLGVPADSWAVDSAEYGGLPLNYALQMCEYSVAQVLVDAMKEERWMEESIIPVRARPRFAECIAGGIDHYENLYQLEAQRRKGALRNSTPLNTTRTERGSGSGRPTTSLKGEEGQIHGGSEVSIPEQLRASQKLLRSMAEMWGASVDGNWVGMDPLKYAFHVAAKHAVTVLMDFVDLWTVDCDSMLPVEQALNLGLKSTAEAAAERMLRQRPQQIPAEAAWSLARCRKHAHFPEELVGEVIIVDLLLKKREGELAQARINLSGQGPPVTRESTEKRSSMTMSKKNSIATPRGSLSGTRNSLSMPSREALEPHSPRSPRSSWELREPAREPGADFKEYAGLNNLAASPRRDRITTINENAVTIDANAAAAMGQSLQPPLSPRAPPSSPRGAGRLTQALVSPNGASRAGRPEASRPPSEEEAPSRASSGEEILLQPPPKAKASSINRQKNAVQEPEQPSLSATSNACNSSSGDSGATKSRNPPEDSPTVPVAKSNGAAGGVNRPKAAHSDSEATMAATKSRKPGLADSEAPESKSNGFQIGAGAVKQKNGPPDHDAMAKSNGFSRQKYTPESEVKRPPTSGGAVPLPRLGMDGKVVASGKPVEAGFNTWRTPRMVQSEPQPEPMPTARSENQSSPTPRTPAQPRPARPRPTPMEFLGGGGGKGKR